MDEETKLHDMTKKLTARREEVAGLKGEQREITKQLNAEGCADADESSAEAAKETKKGKKLRSKFNREIADLENDYEWG